MDSFVSQEANAAEVAFCLSLNVHEIVEIGFHNVWGEEKEA